MAEIEFSDKYQPLFELLVCWEELERLKAIKRPSKKQRKKQREELAYWKQMSKIDTVLVSGGRDSGKTFALSTFNGIAVHDHGHRILYTRQTMSSTDNSISQAIENRLELLGLLPAFEYANHDYTLKDGRKGKISITGQKTSVGTQTAKLKSLEDYSIFETDEGEELESYESWQKVKRSMRAKDVQCLSIIVFNPPTREHWIAKEFYEGIPDGFNGIRGTVLYIHTTYLDNGRENMAEHNWLEYEELRAHYEIYQKASKELRETLPQDTIKKAKRYKYEILGAFKLRAEGVIYEDWTTGVFQRNGGSLHGLDFGSNDPDACVEVSVDEKAKKIYLREVFFQNNLSTGQLEATLEKLVGKGPVIIADSAGKRSIRDLWDQGFEIEKCLKKDVAYDIKTLQGYTLVVSPESVNLMKALNNYRWAVSKAGVPNHDWSDLCDAFRYAAIYIIRGGRGGGVI